MLFRSSTFRKSLSPTKTALMALSAKKVKKIEHRLEEIFKVSTVNINLNLKIIVCHHSRKRIKGIKEK